MKPARLFRQVVMALPIALVVACGSDSSNGPSSGDEQSSSSSDTNLPVSSAASSSSAEEISSSSVADLSSSSITVSSSSFDWNDFCWPGTECATSSSSDAQSSSSTTETPSSSSAIVASSSSQAGGELVGDQMWDHRDDKIYAVQTLGGKKWTTAMDFEINGGSCYAGLETNCDNYGRLYTYSAAKQVCPGGWHLPSRSEIAAVQADLVLQYAGRMKAGTYDFADQMGFLWTSTLVASTGDSDNCTEASCALMYVEKAPSYDAANEKKFQLDAQSKGFSVRCVQD